MWTILLGVEICTLMLKPELTWLCIYDDYDMTI